MVHLAAEMERAGLRLPLLIGGATTSRTHTAVKIEPRYQGPTVHVTDASRAVDVVGQLLSNERSEAYTTDIRQQYETIRDTYGRKNEARLVEWSTAQANHGQNGLSSAQPPPKTGVKCLRDYDLSDLRSRIDWTPFLRTWELPGRWPATLKTQK